MSHARFSTADILSFVEARAGLVFPKGRVRDVERSVTRLSQRVGLPDGARLLERLRGDGALLNELLADLVIGETYFFREPRQFACIRAIVLPDLLHRRAPQAPLAVWSAGCATGEEAYSLAILLEQEGLSARSTVLATDLSGVALKKAARASYEQWSFRGLNDDFIRTYFRPRGGRYHLIDRVREQVQFAPANLASETYPRPAHASGYDLIVCRNVLVYFGAQTVHQVAQRFFESLKPGGWLVTAPSDPPLWDIAGFETRMTDGGIFYQKPPVKKQAALPPKSVSSNIIPFRRKTVQTEPLPSAAPAPKIEPPDYRHSVEACQVHADALCAENRPGAMLAFLAGAVVWHPLSRELHYLYAVTLMNQGKLAQAADMGRRLVYLDRRSVAAHMLLGTIAKTCGDYAGALRAYRNGLSFCGDAGQDDIVPLTGSERYGRVAAALAAEIASLQNMERVQ